ncbi:uncharacterized protein [Thunnus thynnus]|uniref:uncharacterized protein isoform X1 n=1 Tax=Thunnus thynnus TaxID=8237 RepID=UPI003528616D
MPQYHISIQEGSQRPPVQKCSQCCRFYHCPLCSPHIYKPAHRYKVYRHLQCHLSRAIHFRGYSIYKCNLGCRPQAHFHCFCKKLLLNRNQFTHHLNTKHQSLPAVDHPVCPGVKGDHSDDDAEQTLPLSPSPGEPLNANPSPLSSSGADYAATWTSGTFSNIVNEEPTLNNEPASAPSDDVAVKPCQAEVGPKKLAACPQCNAVMNKRCLNMHIRMKHSSRTAHVTASSPLRESPPAVGGSELHLSPTPVELEILTQLRVLRQQQSQILQLLQKLTNTDGTPDSTAADLRAMFPITEEDGLADLELKLSENPDLNSRLVNFFGDTDGLPIDQTAQRILERMLSNTFAKRMDWRGKNNKVSFASSCLKEIVNDAVRRNSVCARAADEAVESIVKKWLQQAGERDEGTEGRREERTEVEEDI